MSACCQFSVGNDLYYYRNLKDTYNIEQTNLHAKHAVDAFCRNNVENPDGLGALFFINLVGKRTQHILLPPQQEPSESEVTLKRLRFTAISGSILGIIAGFAVFGLGFASAAGVNFSYLRYASLALTSAFVVGLVAGVVINYKMKKLEVNIEEQRILRDLKADFERIQKEVVTEPVFLDIPAEPKRLFRSKRDRAYCHITTAKDLQDPHAIDNAKSKAEASSKRYFIVATVIALISVTLGALAVFYGQDFTRQFVNHTSYTTPLYISIGTLSGAVLALIPLRYLAKKGQEKENESMAAAWLTWRTDKLLREMNADNKTADQLHDEFQKMERAELRLPVSEEQNIKTRIRMKFNSLQEADKRQFMANVWSHYYLAQRINKTMDPKGLELNVVVYWSLMGCVDQFKPTPGSIELEPLT